MYKIKFPDPKDTKWIPGKINDSKRRDNYKIPMQALINTSYETKFLDR